jgi:hypothetical protein
MRAIIRFTIKGEGHGLTSNEIRGLLDSEQFRKIGNTAYEAIGLAPADVLRCLGRLAQLLEEPPGGGSLAHLWVYADSEELES